MRVRNARLAAEGVENGCVICGISLGVRTSDRFGALESGTRPRPRGIRVPEQGIVNLDGRGMLLVSVARRLGSEGPLLTYCAAPI
jgi:hypothetical protein